MDSLNLTYNSKYDHHMSTPIAVPMLDGQPCTFIVERYLNDPCHQDFHTAIKELLSHKRNILDRAEQAIFAYYQDANSVWEPDDEEFLLIKTSKDVWSHIQFGNQIIVRRRKSNDQRIYLLLICECDWEEEHGLLLVFKDGKTIVKVGKFDDHVSNADAYGDPKLENVIYKSFR